MDNSSLCYKSIRVRTGCLTCRKRRVKCDELKPVCMRCIKANVICDGYQKKRPVASPNAAVKTPQHIDTETDTEAATAFSINFASPSSSESTRYTSSPRLPLSAPTSSFPRPRHRSELAFYHHFVTNTAPRLFDLDYIAFWRDHVGSMAWENDSVFEALLALGAIHHSYLLSASGSKAESMMQSKVSGLRSYGETLRLMESYAQKDGSTDMKPAIVALVLLAYCECMINHIKPALLHLKAAGQLLNASLSSNLSLRHADYGALHGTVTRLDFLAQSIVPYSQPSLLKSSSDACNLIEMPGSLSVGLDHHSISTERVELVQIISKFNHLDNIIWGPWSSKSSRPSPETLSQFQMDLLCWRANSPLTFESCFESLAILPDPHESLDGLPIPPQPLFFQSNLAALSVALYNNYMACSFSMLSNGHNLDQHAHYVFHYVYQNLRIAEGLSIPTMKDNENIDINISLLLYLGFRRCYSKAWQKWTIQKLRQCGQQGLLDGNAFANTLETIYHLQLRADLQSDFTSESSFNITGPLHTRILPLLQPRDETDRLVAYYLRPMITSGSEEIDVCIIARATWKQDKRGSIASVQFDFHDGLTVTDADVASSCGWSQPLEIVSPRQEAI